MAEFLTNLWEGVFTPGPTPTLLLATNATFALLQLTLAGLLFATFSIHFVVLSALCGGLWAAINWFAAELAAAAEKEDEAERIRKRNHDDRARRDGEAGAAAAARGDGGSGSGTPRSVAEGGDTPGGFDAEVKEKTMDELKRSGETTATAGPASALQPPAGETRQRRAPSDMTASGEISTDSEWEKVEEEER
ncbi:hypothetical protein MBLNU459_g4224t1 [Dothideomycetes sp. NU459]